MIIEDYANNSNETSSFKLWSIIRILVAQMKQPPRNQITLARISQSSLLTSSVRYASL